VQFNHRMLAYVVLVLALVQAVVLRRPLSARPIGARAVSLFGGAPASGRARHRHATAGRAALGGLAHQGLAMLCWSFRRRASRRVLA
jgi:heme A synthase